MDEAELYSGESDVVVDDSDNDSSAASVSVDSVNSIRHLLISCFYVNLKYCFKVNHSCFYNAIM